MADLGLEPQSVHVTAFHAAKLAPSLKIGEKEDLDVRDRRVAVLGLEEFSERQSEFDFDATHGSDAPETAKLETTYFFNASEILTASEAL